MPAASAKFAPPGPLQITGAVAVVTVFLTVTVPQLGEIGARARTREAKGVLHEFVAAAKAHHLQAGTYRCGACGVHPPARSRLTLAWEQPLQAAGDDSLASCLALAEPFQNDRGFRAAAVRPDANGCWVWTIDHLGRLRQQRAGRP